MADNLTLAMRTIFVLYPVAVLCAGVWKHHVIILRLFEATAIAAILGHFVLSVGEIAVRARPVVEGKEALDDFFTSSFLLFTLTIFIIHDHTTFLFLFILTNGMLQ